MESGGRGGGGDNMGYTSVGGDTRKKYLHKDHRTERPWKTTVYSKM